LTLEDQGMDARTILKWIFKQCIGESGIDLSG